MPESDLLSGLIGAVIGASATLVSAFSLYWHNGWQTARYRLKGELGKLRYHIQWHLKDDDVNKPWEDSMGQLWPLHLEHYRWLWIGHYKAAEAWCAYKGITCEKEYSHPDIVRAPQSKKEFLERIDNLLDSVS